MKNAEGHEVAHPGNVVPELVAVYSCQLRFALLLQANTLHLKLYINTAQIDLFFRGARLLPQNCNECAFRFYDCVQVLCFRILIGDGGLHHDYIAELLLQLRNDDDEAQNCVLALNCIVLKSR